ncbi:MAG: SpoIIE family protein phosphatase [Ornithinibacter sp.]
MHPLPSESRLPRISHEVGQTLTRIARVTSELTTATTVDAVTKIVTQHMADAVGATIAALALREGPDHVRLLGLRGLESAEAAQWQTFSLDIPTTVSDVVRSGERIVLVGAHDIADRYPELKNADRGERATVTVPLRTAGRTIGAIHLSLPEAVQPHPAELEFIDILADTCAQALERIEASTVADRQTSRLAFLAEASIQLSSSLDLGATTEKVARLAVPQFADWCAIDIVRDGALHRMAVAHVDPEKVELAHRVHERWPPDLERGSGIAQVVRTGEPLLLPRITEQTLRAMARDEEQLALMLELGLASALIVPLVVRGRVSGVLSWVSTDPERLYDEDDVRFAEHLARRSASALDNADLYSQTRAVAEQLQRAVLPDTLVGTSRWEVHCHYQPSGRTEVGGDFYDGFPLDDDRFVVLVGDVMGRGVAAAAAMAQMRSAVRAFATVDPSPDAVIDKLDHMVDQLGIEQLVTLAYVLADARKGTVSIANAGHPPPFVLRAHGVVDQLPFAEGPPLGLATNRLAQTVPFDAGDTLLIVTDGLIERRGEDLDAGLARLTRAVGLLTGPALADDLARVVASVADDRSDDDEAALVLRRSA